MPINTKLGVLVQAVPALSRLVQLSLPAKSAYDVAKLVKKVQAELDIFNELRKRYVAELEEKHESAAGEPSESRIPAHNVGEFNRLMQDLCDKDISLETNALTLVTLGDAAVSPSDLMLLGDLFVE